MIEDGDRKAGAAVKYIKPERMAFERSGSWYCSLLLRIVVGYARVV
jgi:hypothetical protein